MTVFHHNLHCYAAVDRNRDAKSASGGMATAMAAHVLVRGGCFFSTRYSDDFTPAVIPCSDVSELDFYRGSKYAQSILSNECLKDLAGRLERGDEVLFAGTPCQCGIVRKYLGRDFDNLILVDIICHGVTPARYFREELDFVSKGRVFDNVRFRGGDKFNYHLSLWKDGKCLYDKPADRQPYLYAYLHGLTLREKCYSCDYARPERVGDITVGDYIGLTGDLDMKNPSVVLVNTAKGESFFNEFLSSAQSVEVHERDYKERLAYAPSLLKPSSRGQLYDKCRKEIAERGFPRGIRHALRPVLLRKLLTTPVYRLKKALGISFKVFD